MRTRNEINRTLTRVRIRRMRRIEEAITRGHGYRIVKALPYRRWDDLFDICGYAVGWGSDLTVQGSWECWDMLGPWRCE